MIKNYKLINAYVNLETENEKVCHVKLEIEDEEYIKKAKEICDSDCYYKDGWIVEFSINKKTNEIENSHELFYLGDNGMVHLSVLESNKSNNEKFIFDLDLFLKQQIK